MGKGTIEFFDNEDGTIGGKVSFDPPLDIENNEATPAQHKLLDMWERMVDSEGEPDDE
jgi:hypothetical protein